MLPRLEDERHSIKGYRWISIIMHFNYKKGTIEKINNYKTRQKPGTNNKTNMLQVDNSENNSI